jgi:hypothetical protein
MHYVARTGFALRANHGCAFSDAPQRFSQISRTADERHFEALFVYVVRFVGGSEDLRFINVIPPQGLPESVPLQSGRCGTWPSPGWSPHP